MDEDREHEGSAFPEALRAAAAATYEELWPAINEGRWRDAGATGRRILGMLRDYSDASLPTPVAVERAWSHFAVGMEAKDAGRLGEAASCLGKAADVLPRQWWPSATGRALWMLAAVQEERGDFGNAISTLQKLLSLLGNEPQRRGPVLFAIGCNHERRSERENAIRAYSQALEQHVDFRLDEARDWRHKARAGIVRCQVAETRPVPMFWDSWCKAGRASRLVLIMLALAAAVLFGAAVRAVVLKDYAAAGWWLALSAVLMLVLLLPVLRRVSGRGFTIELQEQKGVTFAIELEDAPTLAQLEA